MKNQPINTILSHTETSIREVIDSYFSKENPGHDEEYVTNKIEEETENLKRLLFYALKLQQYPGTFREWMQKTFTPEQLKEIAEKGAEEVWPGKNICKDISRLYQQYHKQIWETLTLQNGDCSLDSNILEYVDCSNVDTQYFLEETLVWWMAEYTAEQLMNL